MLNGKRKETMADVIKKSTNKFTKGLIMDFSPENTQNEVLTHALNATLLTFNGNELSLQNDMGNARVETAFLPEGFIPVGTCEYGGIIYIVSYNPLENKSLIGCFPSPERNISKDELGETITTPLHYYDFQELDENDLHTGRIKNTSKNILLKNDELHPGDKFIVTSDSNIYENALADLYIYNTTSEKFEPKEHPIIALNIVSIEESGKIIYLNSDIRQYEYSSENALYKYHILGETDPDEELSTNQLIDLDSYRNILTSGYSVFKQKTSGKLALLAELIMIDSYSVTHSLEANDSGGFNIVIHNEVSPNIDTKNWIVAPKLKYLYLENSLGYLQLWNESGYQKIPLFNTYNNLNTLFLTTRLKTIFTSSDPNMFLDSYTLGNTAEFNFPKKETYHGTVIPVTNPNLNDSTLISKFCADDYYRINLSQIVPFVSNEYDYTKYLPYYASLNAQYYNYKSNASESEFDVWTGDALNSNYTYFIENKTIEYKNAKRDTTHEGKQLYKIGSNIQLATSTQIYDTNIDKYAYLTVYKYSLAQEEDINNPAIRKFYKDGDTYKEAKLLEEFNQTLYIQNTESNLINLGPVLTELQISGYIYYYPEKLEYIAASTEDVLMYWDFDAYPKTDDDSYGCSITLYYQDVTNTYREATKLELLDYKNGVSEFYYLAVYTPIIDIERDIANGNINVNTLNLYIKFPKDTYVPYSKFIPTPEYNWIAGYEQPKSLAPNENSIILYKMSEYIPLPPTETNYNPYDDVVLASIELPEVLTNAGIDLPFKYDYTIVPCMNYGRLDHLKVSNTVDFSNLHNFNKSTFHTWKYRIDGNLLRLTFGADVYDTYETDKVDGLVLEFYDLWGYVGTLEITNKKSYNGVFTKILQLNSLNTLTNNKIGEKLYSHEYQHNVNIQVTGSNAFLLEGKPVEYKNYNLGWRYKNSSSLNVNDVGVLYSNMLYGVKTYLRRTKNTNTSNPEFEFIEKELFFVYTIPLFNDYYYNTNNFNNIHNPQIDFTITYKLSDYSTMQPYSTSSIVNGFTLEDKETMDLYLTGNYEGDGLSNELSIIKYYNYVGNSRLSLEIGLKLNFVDLGFKYDPLINTDFSCSLQLLGNDGSKVYSVVSNVEGLNNTDIILNYNQVILNDVNRIRFENTQSSIDIESLLQYNFFHNSELSYINIDYSFVVGYKAYVKNIRKTLVPVTTVCALLHQDSTKTYNYSDFGLEYKNGEYLSSTVFFNSGDVNTEKFGLCKLVFTVDKHSTYPDIMNGQLRIDNEIDLIQTVETSAIERHTPGAINALAMKEVAPLIGKLSFQLPHVHAITNEEGTTLEFGLPNVGWYSDTQNKHSFEDLKFPSDTYDSDGVCDYDFAANENFYNSSLKNLPKELFIRNLGDENGHIGAHEKLKPGYHVIDEKNYHFLSLWPKFNLSPITKLSIQQYSLFISALHYKPVLSGWTADPSIQRAYTGFTGKQLANFNKKLVETMKYVYAYNPDYDYLEVNTGNVTIQDNDPKFISNIICTNSDLTFKDGKTLNDYVYLGNILFSDYLSRMAYHSKNAINNNGIIIKNADDKFIEQVQLQANLTNCGTTENPVLISSLTYSLPAPESLSQELQFDNSNLVIVKTHEGKNYSLTGIPNKKTLYGYYEALNRLIELDVSNYEIEADGKLNLKDIWSEFNWGGAIQGLLNNSNVSITSENNSAKVNMLVDIPNHLGEDLTTISSTINIKKSTSTSTIVKCDPAGIYYSITREPTKSDYIFQLEHESSVLNNKLSLSGDVFLYLMGIVRIDFDFDYLKLLLLLQSYDDLLGFYSIAGGLNVTKVANINGETVKCTNIMPNSNPTQLLPHGYIEWTDNSTPTTKNSIYLIKVGILTFNYRLSVIELPEHLQASIISVEKTKEYASKTNHVYQVNSTYSKSCIKGSSITLNDLSYEPNKDGHRLFLNNNYSYDSHLCSKIVYRSMNDISSWNLDTLAKNSLYFYTGPCYTESNLT